MIKIFNKIQSLNNLVDMRLNVHKFYIPESYEEYKDIINRLEFCTLRTDHKDKTEDLPFYIYDKKKDPIGKLETIWNVAEKESYKLIISDGIKYDAIQEYNMVVNIQQNGKFELEASELKIPLRHMYKHPLLSCAGAIGDDANHWITHKFRYGINRNIIKDDLEVLYNYGIFNHWLEVTKYPIPVGTQNQNIIFWQII